MDAFGEPAGHFLAEFRDVVCDARGYLMRPMRTVTGQFRYPYGVFGAFAVLAASLPA